MTLEELIAELKLHHPARVVKDGFSRPHSYRGDYSQLAFVPAEDVSIGQMLQAAESSLGQSFQGYKGGHYTMGGHVECYLAEVGESGEELGRRLLSYMLAESK